LCDDGGTREDGTKGAKPIADNKGWFYDTQLAKIFAPDRRQWVYEPRIFESIGAMVLQKSACICCWAIAGWCSWWWLIVCILDYEIDNICRFAVMTSVRVRVLFYGKLCLVWAGRDWYKVIGSVWSSEQVRNVISSIPALKRS
jgi:hypothetical protein